MATNKHAQIRYKALDKCFRNLGRSYDWEALLVECNNALFDYSPDTDGISRRQIFSDIKFMESDDGYSAPIARVKDGRKTYYKYADLNFSITNQPLNESEANQLKEVLLTLGRFKGMPQFEWIEEMSARLESAFNLKTGAKQIIEFDQNEYLKGLEHIQPLFNAIVYKTTLKVTYHPFKHEHAMSFSFHPYFLKQYNNRWFAFGWNNNDKYVMNIALDRVQMIEAVNEQYIENETIDFSEYFEDVIGPSINNGKVETIRIKVNINHYAYPFVSPNNC